MFVKANRVPGRSSRRCIFDILAGLSRRLGTPLLKTIAAGIILLACQNSVNAQLTILHNFGDGTVANDGADPAGLIQAPNGDFFGATESQASAPSTKAGTIFRMTPSGKLVVIHSFGSKFDLSLGPLLYYNGALIGISSGIFTWNLFALTKTDPGGWHFNNWFNFSPATNGLVFPSDLMLGSDGFLYGTTQAGGPNGYGTVFKFDPTSHQLTFVYGFSATDPASEPINPLVEGQDGNFYGATFELNGAASGYGGLFQVTPAGQAAFWVFGNPVTGNAGDLKAVGPMIQTRDGTFYGVGAAFTSPAAQSPGIVFQWSPAGGSSILHSFGQGTDGADPDSTVVQGPNGDLYGVTPYGGTAGYGIIYEVSTQGNYTILHNFGDGSFPNDGKGPNGPLIVGKEGKSLYGTTGSGGSAGLGTVFKFSLSP